MDLPEKSESLIAMSSFWSNWINTILFPLKMIVPQPIIAKIPGLTTNEDIRMGLAMQEIRGRLLDIGCGSNRLVRNYNLSGGEGFGIDVYPWDGVDRVVEDSSRLPFQDASFDTVTMVASFNHIPNRETVLREGRRLLAPGGRLILTNLTPHISKIWHGWAFWDKDQHERGMKEGEVWGFTTSELLDILSRNGFTVIKHIPFSWGLNHMFVCAADDNYCGDA